MIVGNPPLPSPFWPQWLMHPMRDGRVSLARSDGAAVFLTDAKAGRVVRIEVPVRGTPFLPRERAEWQALLEFGATRMSLPVPRLPATKPVFARIQVDANGTLLWLQRPVQARPAPPEQRLSLGDGAPVLSYAEPMAFSAVAVDGTYLGELAFERLGIGRISFAGDAAWGIARGKSGASVLVKWGVPVS
ncbi:MAG: hypothetical protein V9E87_09205 [Gemmatimonadales bacterium]